ncbi:rhomboid family protein [Pseudidiomarina halophila]|uniref:hypothetical protein n=1 Tax=Pseudidiomarina halophila TaxID=1449799 RepID=UPI0036195A1D
MQVLGFQIPTSRDAIAPTLSVMAILTLIMLLPGTWQDALKLNRHAVLEGQYLWQLITGQLVHHSWSHLALNLLGLMVCWALFIDHQRGWQRWLGVPVIMLSSSLAQIFSTPMYASMLASRAHCMACLRIAL